jgi:hypothetical protein
LKSGASKTGQPVRSPSLCTVGAAALREGLAGLITLLEVHAGVQAGVLLTIYELAAQHQL